MVSTYNSKKVSAIYYYKPFGPNLLLFDGTTFVHSVLCNGEWRFVILMIIYYLLF